VDQESDTHQERTRQVDELRRGVLPTSSSINVHLLLLLLFHISMITYCPPQWHLVDSRSDKGSSGCQNINKNYEYKGCILKNLSTY